MKYLSLDLETTSLIANPNHILQISMVVEDTKRPEIPVEDLPHFTCFINHEKIEGQSYALSMNGWILDYLSGRTKNAPYPIINSSDLVPKALEFLTLHFGNEKIIVAGKNVAGFDIPFLPQEIRVRFKHKTLDPGSMFIDWSVDDQPPSLDICKERAGISGEVKHDAREDAMDVIKIIRTRSNK